MLLEPLNAHQADDFKTKQVLSRGCSTPSSTGRRSTASRRTGRRSGWRPTRLLPARRRARRRQTWAQLRSGAEVARRRAVRASEPICLWPDWARLLAFIYQNKGSFLNATKSGRPSTPARLSTSTSACQERPRRHTPPSSGRLVRRGARQGASRDRLRGQLVLPYMTEPFPTCATGSARCSKGKTQRQPRLHGLVLDGEGLEEQERRLDAAVAT